MVLLNIGRPKEAEWLYTGKLEINVKEEQWEAASIGYRNLADLQLRAGRLGKGFLSAKRALELAEKTSHNFDF